MSQKLTERFEMRLSENGVVRLDEWRREQRDLPSRAEAIRRLVDYGLEFREVVEFAAEATRLLLELKNSDRLTPEEWERLESLLVDYARGVTNGAIFSVPGMGNELSHRLQAYTEMASVQRSIADSKPAEDGSQSGLERTIDYAKDSHISPDAYVRSVGKPTRQKFPKPPKKL